MDIIKVNKNSVTASIDQCAFEINSILAHPEESGSLERLDKATAKYGRLSNQLQILNMLEKQTQQAQEQPTQNED
tara:strand:+ start:100 stop:324 length:225 start_codon:yes stop_codon:yes gene_type:complete